MSLTNKDASIILAMLKRGDYNHDIAAWFGENPARIAEVKGGAFGATVTPSDSAELPPKGSVGPKARRLRGRVNSAIDLLEKGGPEKMNEALSLLKDAIVSFNKNEA